MTCCNRLVIRVRKISAEAAATDDAGMPSWNHVIEIPRAIESIMIGSDPAVNLRLDSPEVSGVHARIARDVDQFTIEDLTSRNGTELNAKRISPGKPAMIVPGDTICIGPFEMDIAFSAVPEVRHKTTLADRGVDHSGDVDAIIERFALPAKYPKIVVSNPISAEVQPLVLEDSDRPYSMGRHASCDYVIDSPAVSRRHASVFRTADDHVFIQDCGSSNGIRVNGKLISGTQALQDGDRIEIGPITCELELPRLESLDIKTFHETDTPKPPEPSEGSPPLDHISGLGSRMIRWLVSASAVAGIGSLMLAIWSLFHLL